jgi:kynurenine--oxoglutarate transaminase/cysteine-S-conjugate beta-lyase/glutamine--phenylpyruvate transaminase/kynurenine aminotransferase
LIQLLVIFLNIVDFYRPLIEFTGATHIGVPIKPVKLNNKADLLKRFVDGKFQTS